MQFPSRSRLSAVHKFLADAGRPLVAEVRHLHQVITEMLLFTCFAYRKILELRSTCKYSRT